MVNSVCVVIDCHCQQLPNAVLKQPSLKALVYVGLRGGQAGIEQLTRVMSVPQQPLVSPGVAR